MTTIRKTAFALPLATAAGGALSQGALTREQVNAELAEAIRTGEIVANGEIIVNGETGLTARELSPGAYPMQARGRKGPSQATTAQGEVPAAR